MYVYVYVCMYKFVDAKVHGWVGEYVDGQISR